MQVRNDEEIIIGVKFKILFNLRKKKEKKSVTRGLICATF